MTRYGDSTVLLGRLPSGQSVTIEVWELSTGNSVSLSNNSCTEIGTTGIYRWSTENFSEQPTSETEYAYRMTTGEYQYEGKFTLKAETGASAASIADAVWDEPIADHTSAGTFGAKNQKAVPSENIDDYHADPADIDAQLSSSHGSGSWEGASAADIDAQLSSSHGSGSWEGASAAEVADAVWDEAHADHQTEGSFGRLMKRIHISIDDLLAIILSGLRR